MLSVHCSSTQTSIGGVLSALYAKNTAKKKKTAAEKPNENAINLPSKKPATENGVAASLASALDMKYC